MQGSLIPDTLDQTIDITGIFLQRGRGSYLGGRTLTRNEGSRIFSLST